MDRAIENQAKEWAGSIKGERNISGLSFLIRLRKLLDISAHKRLFRAKMALMRIIDGKRLGVLTYQCNICGRICKSEVEKLNREEPSCQICGSTVRSRAVIHSLSREIFGKSIPIPDFPERPDLTGIGMSDWDGYAIPLSRKFLYKNTFYHKSPRLDITYLKPSWKETQDFIISSDVFEHVAPPISVAFENVYKLLKPRGIFVLTVPYTQDGITREHFPDLYKYEIIKQKDCQILKNITCKGNEQTFFDLVFHDGPGETLEMRYFSEPSLKEELGKAGFKEIQVHNEPYFIYGVYHCKYSQNDSFPITARKASGFSPVG